MLRVTRGVRDVNNWKCIRLELARTADFPTGSVSRAYLIRLPLSEDDTVNTAAVLKAPNQATARRHWSCEPDEIGLIAPVRGGWAMRCSGRPDRLFDLDHSPIREGQEVTVVEPDGSALPFRIAAVR